MLNKASTQVPKGTKQSVYLMKGTMMLLAIRDVNVNVEYGPNVRTYGVPPLPVRRTDSILKLKRIIFFCSDQQLVFFLFV